MELPWSERVNMLSSNPAAATMEDIARMAAELSAVRRDVDETIELGSTQKHSERLAGNIVKEEYWKGELATAHRIRRILSKAPEEKERA